MAITTETFTSDILWTVPSGVFNVTVHAVGGGGGGGGGDNANGNGGGGGGGGGYASIVHAVSPGQQYTITIGTGGAGAPTRGNDGSPGTATSFAALCIANGGAGGIQLPNGGGGGAGGTGNTGTTVFNGGTGGAGSASNCGGGGGGAGTTGPGGNGSGITAGTGTSLYGGNGGAGHNLSNAAGNPGLIYGGGGSGSTRNSTAGSGAQGYLVLEYEIIGGPKPFEPTSNTTVESSETSVTTINQIDIAVVSNAAVETPEVLISNIIDFLDISADSVVASSEGFIENGTFFLPNCTATVDSTEAILLASNVFYPTTNATVSASEADVLRDLAYNVVRNTRVTSTEAVITNENAFLPNTPATVQSSDTPAFNYVNIYPQPINVTVDSSESSVTTIKYFSSSIQPGSLTSDVRVNDKMFFTAEVTAVTNTNTLHILHKGEMPVTLTAVVEGRTNPIATLVLAKRFWVSADAVVESSEFNVSNDIKFSGISLPTYLETEEAAVETVMDMTTSYDVSMTTSSVAVSHISEFRANASIETNSNNPPLTGWADLTFSVTVDTLTEDALVLNRLFFVSDSIVISTVSAGTEVGYSMELTTSPSIRVEASDALLANNGSMYIDIRARAFTASFPLKHIRINSLSFKRYTKVYMKQGKNIWELPILSDFKFSQAAIQKEVTQNQLGHASVPVSRGREVYTDAVEAANWSFKTYMRPFIANPNLDQWEAAVPKHHAVEEPLWANLIQDNTRDAYSWKKQFVTELGVSVAKPVSTATDLKLDFEFSNSLTVGTFDLYFALAGCETSAKTPVTYKIADCVVNEAKIEFDLEGIATIDWSGFGTSLVEPTQVELDSLTDEDMLWFTEGISSTSNLIPCRLTKMFATSYPDSVSPQGEETRTTFPGTDGSGIYNLPLTAGSLIFSNNISHVFRDDMNKINKAYYLLGTRSIGGHFTTYLSNTPGSSKQLFKEILSHDQEQSTFDLNFVIGDSEGQRVEFHFPRAILGLPKHNIDDVIEMESEFAAIPSRFDKADEANITYVAV